MKSKVKRHFSLKKHKLRRTKKTLKGGNGEKKFLRQKTAAAKGNSRNDYIKQSQQSKMNIIARRRSIGPYKNIIRIPTIELNNEGKKKRAEKKHRIAMKEEEWRQRPAKAEKEAFEEREQKLAEMMERQKKIDAIKNTETHRHQSPHTNSLSIEERTYASLNNNNHGYQDPDDIFRNSQIIKIK